MATQRLSRTGLAVAFLLLLSFAFNGLYLTGGFQADEFFFLNTLRQDPAPFSRWLGLWAFEEMPEISRIWWFEGDYDMGGFWRPLPSMLFEGSIRLFGERAFPLHLLSVVAHGLIAGLLFLLVRGLTGRPAVGLLAGIVFLSCEDHSMVVGWIATMTDVVCDLFAALALVTHAAWLRTRRPALLVVSLAAMIAAMLSKESAVVLPLAIILMTLLMPEGRDRKVARLTTPRMRSAAARFLRDWPSWLGALLLIVAYLLAYRLLGFGTISSAMYVDPFTEPVRFLSHSLTHLPVAWLATLSPVPPSLALFSPETIPALAIAGGVLFVLWLVALWPLRHQSLVVWSLLVFLGTLLPQMGTDASERALYLPALASSVLLALLLARIGPLARRVAPDLPPAAKLSRVAGWSVLMLVVAPGFVLSFAYPFMYLPSGENLRENVARAAVWFEERHPEYVLMLNTPGLFYTFYPPPILKYYTSPDIDVRVLSSLNGVVSVERVDERSFVIRADRAGWLTNFFAKVLRSSRELDPGEVFEKPPLRATILETTDDGLDLRAVRFELDRALDDPSLLILQWDGTQFAPLDLLSLAPGDEVVLADTSDLWKSMS